MTQSLANLLDSREEKKLAGLKVQNFRSGKEMSRQLLGLADSRDGRALISCKDLPTTLMAPLFYDQSLVALCQHNAIAKEPGLLRWMGERDLIYPVLETRYENLGSETVTALHAIPHASGYAFSKLNALYAEFNDLGCRCINCAREGVISYKHLPKENRALVDKIVKELGSLPQKVRDTSFDMVNEAIRSGDLEAIRASRDVIALMNRLAQARACAATPQTSIDLTAGGAIPKETTEFFVKELNIEYSSSVDKKQYLTAIEPYRGALSFMLREGASMEKAATVVEEINGQVRRLYQSKRRMAVYNAMTRRYSKQKKEAVERILNNVAGVPSAITGLTALAGSAVVAAASPGTNPRIRNRLLAAYFGTALPAIQVWRIREKLQRL